MKELIPMNEFGVFADIHDTPRVDSRFVAQFFEKRHDHVLRDVENLIAPKFGEIEESVSGLSQAFIKRNFALSSYKDNRGRSQKAYAMTRDGFTMLVMGYTGQKAMRFKEQYIRRFNEMEQFIETLVSAREQFPKLTRNIRLLHENPKPYHFSKEQNFKLRRFGVRINARFGKVYVRPSFDVDMEYPFHALTFLNFDSGHAGDAVIPHGHERILFRFVSSSSASASFLTFLMVSWDTPAISAIF